MIQIYIKGKNMSKKEAYRYMCYIFHNKRPSKKKVEKKLLREEMEEKLKNRDLSKDSKFIKFFKNEQEKTKKPYILIQGKNFNNI